ncbi:MAG: hypothetical protein ACWGSQ_14035 [Longimicrobiales bacterium]
MERIAGILLKISLFVLVGLWVACGQGERRQSAPTVRDSAGVEILVLGEGILPSASAWSQSPEPVLQVGAVEGAPEFQLHRIRAGLILNQDLFAIVNGGSQEIRSYDAEGGFRWARGSVGEGPGEYQGLQSIFRLPGDSILAWDGSLRRATVLGPAGEFGRTLSLHGEFISPSVAGTFGDGTVLVTDARFNPGDATGDWQQLLSTVVRYSAGGEPLDSIGTFPWYRMKFMVANDSRAEALRLGFDRETQLAVRGKRAVIGTTKQYEVLEFEPTGDLVRIIRWAGPDQTVTDAHRDAYLQERLAVAPNDEIRRLIRTDHENRTFADQFPAYSTIRVDDRNRIWVEMYRRPGSPDVNRWLVFDENGILQASLPVPTDLRLLDIRGERVLAVFTDDLGIEYIRIFRIESL